MKKIKFLTLIFLIGISFHTHAQLWIKVDTSFYSEMLNETKMIDVYLPPNYYEDTTQKYAVIYVLHGATGDQNQMNLPAQIYYEIHDTTSNISSPPAIVVCPDASCENFLGSYYLNSVLNGNYEDYMILDVIGFIDNNYRTKSDKNFRMITGASMGGFGAVHLTVSYPDLFRASFPFFGYLSWPDTTMNTWRTLCYEENGSYNLNYDAGINTQIFISRCGAICPNLNLPPYFVEIPFDTNGVWVDTILRKWNYYDASRKVKDLPDEHQLAWFLGCGKTDYMCTFPTYWVFMDSLDNYGISYDTAFFNGGHVFHVPTWIAGMYWMDSIINQSFLNNQIINMSNGYQFISSHIIPENPDMTIVMADVLNYNLDFVRNSQGSMLRKIGPNWVNGIGDWIVEEGYLVKMFADDLFTINGTLVDPATPIPVATGFQFISYFPETPMDALLAFETIIGDDLDFIRDSEGTMIRKIGPNWVNGIGDAMPGEGYLVKMFADDEIIYPAGAKSSGKITAVPTHFTFNGGNAADPVYTIYIAGLEIGDEVAAFDGDVIVGVMKVNSQNAFENELPVFSTLVNGKGYEESNPITLKVCSENSIVATDFTMEAMYDSYVSDVYPAEDGKYSIVNITKGSIEKMEETIFVYPNPVTGILNINSNYKVLNVKVLNYIGQIIDNINVSGMEVTINTSTYNSGIYFIQFETEKGNSTQKIIIE
jgi:S-formylglutathione hydrolase FrmB